MPENVFRLIVVGLLFMVLSQVGEGLSGFLWFIVGSAFVICGFVAWIQERQAAQRRREALQ